MDEKLIDVTIVGFAPSYCAVEARAFRELPESKLAESVLAATSEIMLQLRYAEVILKVTVI